MTNSSPKRAVLMMGQTPPPWHGQAVGTLLLFEHDWPDFDVHRLRMGYSGEMDEVGRFQWKKIRHLFELIGKARRFFKQHRNAILFYPPASPKWIPFLRDVIFLVTVRRLAGDTVFIFHAGGLAEFTQKKPLARWLARLAYARADLSLEVAHESPSPHRTFHAKDWNWCPCGIEIPELKTPDRHDGPLEILFVASLQEGKGVLEILKTAKVLKDRGQEEDFRFRIVGKWFSDEFETQARQLREEWGVAGMVDFVGQLVGNQKWDAYSSADVFFFPTHYGSEASPIVLMEALGTGLPVISTLWRGIPTMLEGCRTATLLPIRSPESYAVALNEWRLRRHSRDETARQSREFYASRFLPERFIERVNSAFHAVSNQNECGNLRIQVYLADQNPGYDRSYGISRMSQLVLEALQATDRIFVDAVLSATSQRAPDCVDHVHVFPWGTRRKWVRLLTDHFHPLFRWGQFRSDLYYFPKGYLPLLSRFRRPSAVTIHDTIIQYDEDHYPRWRSRREYAYWAWMLKHTLRRADLIMTVSESAKQQIHDFMDRHHLPRKEVIVTYEPCVYEIIPQPESPAKENYVIHLASCEPHKRTAHLVRWWHEMENRDENLPMLHLIGSVPNEVSDLLASSRGIVKRPFLEENSLQAAYQEAKALILPSEIEGFGLPALEAYFLGTPVCFVKETSVEEILKPATSKGGFTLDDPASLETALAEVMSMTTEEVREYGLKLRKTYASKKVAERMIAAFQSVIHR